MGWLTMDMFPQVLIVIDDSDGMGTHTNTAGENLPQKEGCGRHKKISNKQFGNLIRHMTTKIQISNCRVPILLKYLLYQVLALIKWSFDLPLALKSATGPILGNLGFWGVKNGQF